MKSFRGAMAGSGGSPGRTLLGFAKPTTRGRLAGPWSRVRPSCASMAASAGAGTNMTIHMVHWIGHAAARYLAAYPNAGSHRGGQVILLTGYGN